MDNQNVAKAIRYLRKSKHITQKELANKLGVSDKAVSKWERGLGIPDVSLLTKLSIILDIDVESLLGGNICHSNMNWLGILCLDTNTEAVERSSLFAGSVIHNKPLYHYTVSLFLLLGISDIVIIGDKIDIEFIKEDINGGNELGITVQCIDSQITQRDLMLYVDRYAVGRNIMYIHGFQFLFGLDLTKIMKRAMSDLREATVLTLLNSPANEENIILFDSSKKATRECIEKHDTYRWIPIFFIRVGLLKQSVNVLKQPSKYIVEELIKRELLSVELVGRGMISIDIDSASTAKEVSKLVEIINQTQNIDIAKLDEISHLRGLKC